MRQTDVEEDSIKMDLKEIWCEKCGPVSFDLGHSIMTLQCYLVFRFHRKRIICGTGEQLLAYQEGFCSMELISSDNFR